MKVFSFTVLYFLAVPLVLASQCLIEEQGGNFEEDFVLIANNAFNRRTGFVDTRYRWTNNVIPYEIIDLTSAQAALFRETLDEMEAILCLRFVPRTTEINYVQVLNSNPGCTSHVGMIGGAQRLNIQSSTPGSGCFRKGNIMELVILTLGIRGMHRASDRDNYVKIIWENITPGNEQYFEKLDSDIYSQFGVPYDYGSVMHYSMRAYSVNGFPTIVPLDPNAIIGQREGMSTSDIQRITNMYCP